MAKALDPSCRALVIVNAQAGKKAFHVRRDPVAAVRTALDATSFAYELVVPASPAAASAAARRARADGYGLVVACGGDGTVSLVASQLVGADTRFGILPLGSMMNVARSLGIPRDLDAAARLLVDGTPRKIDVGDVNGVFFLETAMIGLTAELFAAGFAAERKQLRSLAKILARVRRARPMELRLTVDGRTLTVNAMALTVANTPYTGLLYSVDPDAQVNNGQLDLLVYRHFTKLELVKHFAVTAFGHERRRPRISRLPAQVIRIESSRPLLVMADETCVGETPVDIRVVPGGLTVMTGASPFLQPPRRKRRAAASTGVVGTEERRRAGVVRTSASVGLASFGGVLWNPRVIEAVQQFFGPRWLRPFNAITLLGSTWCIVIVVTVTFWIAGRGLAYKLLGAVLLGTLISSIVKPLTGVRRPHDSRITIRHLEASQSFPSGHTLNATTLWGGLATYGSFPWLLAATLAAAVGTSRMYLGVHYLGDVLGGVAIGAGVLVGWGAAWPHVMHSLARVPFRVYQTIGLMAPLAVVPFLGTYPDGWQILGAIAGAGIGLPLEYQLVRYAPGDATWQQTLARVALGLGVLLALLAGGGLTPWRHSPLAAPWFAAGTLWAALGAPSVFRRLGLAGVRAR